MGRSKEGAGADEGVHGRRGLVEMVPDGRPGGERREVGGAVFPLRETASQEGLVSGRIIRGDRGAVSGDGSVLEIQVDRGGEWEDDQESEGRGREPAIYQCSGSAGDGDDGLGDDSDQVQVRKGRGAGADEGG